MCAVVLKAFSSVPYRLMLKIVGDGGRCVAIKAVDTRLASIETSDRSPMLLTAGGDGHCSIGFSRNLGPVNQMQPG